MVAWLPTSSFIQETAIDNYYERGEDPAPRPPAEYPCEVCGQVSSSGLGLATHLAAAHPLEPPRLLIAGQVVIGEKILRRPMQPDDLLVPGATEIACLEVGGKERKLSLQDLRAEVCSSTQATHVITLRHRRSADGAVAEERVRVRVDVPSAADLDLSDKAFEECFADGRVNDDGLMRFDNATNGQATGGSYVAALYNYCLFIQLRDGRSGRPADTVEARQKAQSAHTVLCDYPERPLARALAALIRFSLNDFRVWDLSGVPELDSCACALSQAAGSVVPPAPLTDLDPPSGSCLVDAVTKEILDAWADPESGSERMELIAADPACSSDDRSKAGVLALLLIPVDAAISETMRPQGRTVPRPGFGRWVAAWMQDRGV